MHLIDSSSVHISALIGALVINPKNNAYIITDVHLELDSFKVIVELEDPEDEDYSVKVRFEDLATWQIQLGNTSRLHGRQLI